MASSNNTRTSRHGGIALFITALLICAISYCCWLIWRDSRQEAALAAAANQEVAELAARRDALKNLLSLSPCETKAALQKMSASGPAPQSAAPAGVLPAAFSVDDIEKGCVFIVSLANNKKISTGSGFFVAPGHVLTNRHVIGGGDAKIFVTSKGLKRPVMAKVVAAGGNLEEDYALLKVSPPAGSEIKVLALDPDVKKTEKVGAWGFPDLVGKNDPKYNNLLKHGDISAVPELSYSEGVVSATLERSPRLVVHTAPISPGNSGGPLLNSRGDVVGINSMITLDEDSYRQASLAIAASDLRKFLARQGLAAAR